MHLFTLLHEFVKENPITVSTNFAFTLLVPLQDVILPHFYGKLIDSITNQDRLKQNIIYVLIIFVSLELGFMLSDWHDIKTISGFQTFTRREIFRNLMQKYETNFTEMHLGSILSQVVKIPYILVVLYERLKNHIVPYVLVILIATFYFGRHDKVLGGTLLVTGIAYACIVLGVPQYYCNNPAMAKDKMVNQIHEEIDDTLRNFIAIHGDKERQQEEIDRLQEYESLFTVKFAESMKCLMKTKMYTSVVILSFTTFFILRSYTLLKKKKMNTAAFASLFLVLMYISNMMMWMEGSLRDMVFDWGALVEADGLFEKPQNLASKSSVDLNKPSDIPTEGIGMRNVSFAFPNSNTPVLKDVSFHIKPGETVLLLGDIGSGKSTILKLLLKFNEPLSGTIYIDGQTYKQMDIKQIKKKVGYVPQQPILFNRTVYENIVYGSEDTLTRKVVEDLITKLGIDKEFENLEQGLDTKIGKNGSKLSGGQRQIVWCIRTMLQKPDIIILDEPTASLDDKSKKTVKLLLNVVMKGKTVIVVTHDDALHEIADRRLYLSNGVIQEQKKLSDGGQHFYLDGSKLQF